MQLNFRFWGPVAVILLLVCLSGGCSDNAELSKVVAEAPRLRVLTWENYVNPNLVAEFESKYGCIVEFTIADTNEEIEAAIVGGRVQHDVAVVSSYVVPSLVSQGLLYRQDKVLRGTLKIAGEKLAGDQLVAIDGWGTPYLSAPTGIALRITAFNGTHNKPDSWHIFLNQNFNRSILGDHGEVYALLAYISGLDPNSVDEAGFALMLSVLDNLVTSNCKQIDDDYEPALQLGGLDVAHAYAGDVYGLMGNNGLEPVNFVLPKEGCLVAIDYAVLPKGGANIDLAESFIKYLSSKENAVRNAEWTGFASPMASESGDPSQVFIPSWVDGGRLAPSAVANLSVLRPIDPSRAEQIEAMLERMR